MKVLFQEIFAKDLHKLDDFRIKQRLDTLIDRIKQAESRDQIPGLKKIRGTVSYYPLRVGSYRLGMQILDEEIQCVRFLHRKEIYRRFP